MMLATKGILRNAAICAATFAAIGLLPPAATAQDDPGEKAIKARQGFMQIVVREAGPLFGMAKGDVEYDADTAADNAGNLSALLDYDVGRLFIPDTSKADYAGKTRALAAIWEDMDGFAADYRDLQEKVAAVAEVAGDGKDALTAAVQGMGQSCGNCHDDYRADEF